MRYRSQAESIISLFLLLYLFPETQFYIILKASKFHYPSLFSFLLSSGKFNVKIMSWLKKYKMYKKKIAIYIYTFDVILGKAYG